MGEKRSEGKIKNKRELNQVVLIKTTLGLYDRQFPLINSIVDKDSERSVLEHLF